MELRQLRYFLAVARHGSVTAAAEQLGRTQQAVSKSLQQLEERLGVRLFDRANGPVRLTAFGEMLVEHARTADDALRRFETEVHRTRHVQSEPLRLGVGPTAASQILPAAVALLSKEIPGLRCEVEGGIVVDLLPKLQRGELDLVVVLATAEGGDAGLASEVLGQESFVVVAGRNHPFAARESLGAAHLAGAQWMLGVNLGEIESSLLGSFEAQDVPPPEIRWRTSSTEFLRAALTTGQFLSVLPLPVVEGDFASGRLRRLRSPGFEWSRRLMLYRRRGVQPAPVVLAGANALHRAAAARGGASLEVLADSAG